MATGLEDLLRRLDGEQPEMALLLVKAPLGTVVSGLADTYGASPLIEEAPVRVASKSDRALDSAGWLAAVAQRDESWVCVYVALGEVVDLERDLVCQVATDLSDTLSTQAIAFIVHRCLTTEEEAKGDPLADGALKVEFEAFSDGETTDRIHWWVDGEMEIFESNGRKTPENPDSIPLELASRLFSDRGIYVPACSPMSRGQQAWLALWDLEPSKIQRADLFRLRGSSFFDDETLAMDVPNIDDDADEGGDGDLATTEESPSTSADDGPVDEATGWRGFLRRLFASRD